MKDTLISIFFGYCLLMGVASLLLFGYSVFFLEEPEVVVAEPNEAGLCFMKFLPYGSTMGWSETSSGRYDYTVYANERGVEIWAPCPE